MTATTECNPAGTGRPGSALSGRLPNVDDEWHSLRLQYKYWGKWNDLEEAVLPLGSDVLPFHGLLSAGEILPVTVPEPEPGGVWARREVLRGKMTGPGNRFHAPFLCVIHRWRQCLRLHLKPAFGWWLVCHVCNMEGKSLNVACNFSCFINHVCLCPVIGHSHRVSQGVSNWYCPVTGIDLGHWVGGLHLLSCGLYWTFLKSSDVRNT